MNLCRSMWRLCEVAGMVSKEVLIGADADCCAADEEDDAG